jgi:hypothetical protein
MYPQQNYYPQAGAVPGQLEAYKQPSQPVHYPMQYPPTMPAQSAAPAPEPQGNGMIWVQGEAGAKAYPVAPGASVVLWDSENPHIYIKSAAFNGIPSMEILRWQKYTPAPPAPQQSYQQGEYASMEAVRELDSKISALSARIDHLTREGNQTQEDM